MMTPAPYDTEIPPIATGAPTHPPAAQIAFRLVPVESPGGGRIQDKRDPAATDIVTVGGIRGSVRLHRLAAAAWAAMVAAARADGIGGSSLLPVSGYRSSAHQIRLFNRAVARYRSPEEARKWVAPPGSSAHQSGRAIDLYLGAANDSANVAILRRTPAYGWLVANARRFGFYPYEREPWHWEYNPPARPDAVSHELSPPAASTLLATVTAGADLAAAIVHGERNPERLTDIAFYARHPERRGRPIAQAETDLAQEWLWIRDKVVLPALALAAIPAGAAPSPAASTASPPAPTAAQFTKATQALQRMALLVPLLDRYRGDIPLEFLLGWIVVESGGLIDDVTNIDERGFFQIHPAESHDRGFQHLRLTSDPEYSVQAGIENVRYYARLAQQRFPEIAVGSELFWRVVKLQHAMGSPLARRLLDGMRASNIPFTWDAIKRYEVASGPQLHRLLRVAPLGRFGMNVDKVWTQGRRYASLLGR